MNGTAKGGTMQEMETIVAAFSFGQLQDAATLIKTLGKAGYSPENLIEYVDARKGKIELRKKIAERSPKCPSCKVPMVLRAAHPPDPKTGDPGDPSEGSHWTCPKCRFGKYDPRSTEAIMKILSST